MTKHDGRGGPIQVQGDLEELLRHGSVVLLAENGIDPTPSEPIVIREL